MVKCLIMARHHYVPQFYLRNFCCADKANAIFVYERNKKPFPSNISNVAAPNDFYSARDEKTGEKDETIELFFSQLESAAKPIFEKIIKKQSTKLSKQERLTLSHFFGFLFVRNKTFRQKTKNLYSEIMKQTMAFAAHDKDRFRKMLEKSGAKFKTEKEFEETRLFALHGEYDIGFKGEEHFIGATLTHAKDLSPIFWGKSWKLLTVDSSRVFVTSDNPMFLAPHEKQRPRWYGLGLLEADIFLPLTPNLVLMMTNNKNWPDKLNLTRKQVKSINTSVSKFASKFIFSNIDSRDISSIFDKTREGESEKVSVGDSFIEPRLKGQGKS